MTFTIEILDEHVLNLFKALEEMQVIRISPQRTKTGTKTPQKKEFKATKLDTRGFKFNQEEANESIKYLPL